jgi:CRP/FNR family cyclic AMP-dependent transcriptional regulator
MHNRWNWHHVRLFQHLSQEQINEILQVMPAKNVRQHDYVYRVGDVADELFVLRAGTVKVFYVTSAGREHIIDIAQSGDTFGDLFLGESRVRLLGAQALEDVVVRRLHSNTLVRLIQQSPDLSMHFLRYMAYAERQMLRRTQVLLQPSPEARLLGVLFSLVSVRARRGEVEFWTHLPETITQEDIANMAALNRSTVSLLINRFRREGMLGGHGRVLSIHTARVWKFLQSLGLEVDE